MPSRRPSTGFPTIPWPAWPAALAARRSHAPSSHPSGAARAAAGPGSPLPSSASNAAVTSAPRPRTPSSRPESTSAVVVRPRKDLSFVPQQARRTPCTGRSTTDPCPRRRSTCKVSPSLPPGPQHDLPFLHFRQPPFVDPSRPGGGGHHVCAPLRRHLATSHSQSRAARRRDASRSRGPGHLVPAAKLAQLVLEGGRHTAASIPHFEPSGASERIIFDGPDSGNPDSGNPTLIFPHRHSSPRDFATSHLASLEAARGRAVLIPLPRPPSPPSSPIYGRRPDAAPWPAYSRRCMSGC